MRKFITMLFIVVLLAMIPVQSFATYYVESKEVLRNPDRGFYILLQVELNKGSEDFASFKDELDYVVEEAPDVGIISFQLSLKQFVDGDTTLSKEKLEDINQYFSMMREYGYQVIFRVVYEKDGDINPEPEFQELLNHIEQLKPIYEKNEDILYVIEAGFLGSYGEWHDGKYDEDKAKRNQVIEKLLEVVPEKIQINLRRPSFITDYIGDNRTVTAENAYSNEDIARLGLHNDGYLGSITDLGTFEEEQRDASMRWQNAQTLYTLFGGECIRPNSNYNEFENALPDMIERHCTYLNKTYDEKVKDKWRNATYNGEDELYKGESGYLYIQNHLGYRLVLREAQVKVSNDNLIVNLQIENVGFGNIVREKEIEVLLKHDEDIYVLKNDVDIRQHLNGNMYTLELIEFMPNEIEDERYQIFVNIKEPYDSLDNNDNYKIKLANVDMWDSEVGANLIGEIELDRTHAHINKGIILGFAVVIIAFIAFILAKK